MYDFQQPPLYHTGVFFTVLEGLLSACVYMAIYLLLNMLLNNTVTIGDETYLYKDEITVCNVNWISLDSLTEPIEVTVKTRYSQNEQEATVCPTENGEVLVKFHKPQRAPAKGQAAVFYQDNIVLGGGTIK